MGVVDDAVAEREGRGPRAAKFERRATTLMQVGGGESALCCFFYGGLFRNMSDLTQFIIRHVDISKY